MIQRIQTLYLIGVIVAGVIFMIIPAAVLIEADSSTFPINGTNSLYTLILECITIFMALLTILLYKKPTVQIRCSVFNIALQIGMPFLVWVVLNGITSVSNQEWRVQVGMGLPLIQLILTWLAMRGIFKDILTLRSLDRLR